MISIVRVSAFGQSWHGWDGNQFANIEQPDLAQYKSWYGSSGYSYYSHSSLTPKELYELKQSVPEFTNLALKGTRIELAN